MFDFIKIEEFLRNCNSARDDAELRRVFATYHAEYDRDLPSDPFSENYDRRQMAIYEQLSGKNYSSANEITSFDVAKASVSPFPYSNGSSELVGNQLMAMGYLIRALRLPKGAKILEFGPGWGNTTLALAKMGFDVTAIDVEKNFCELIAARAQMEKLSIKVIHADFSYIHSLRTQYDAIVFFECFHHAPDHRSLIAAFDSVVKPGGMVCFGSEPITPDFPIPWGLRMDGESIWAIRQNGWFELGFNERYFEEVMRRYGWGLTWSRAHDCPWASVAVARRHSELGGVFPVSGGKLFTSIGQPRGGDGFVGDGRAGYLLYGPYIDLPRGTYKATISIDRTAVTRGTIVLDVSRNAGTEIIGGRSINLGDTSGPLEILFSLSEQSRAVEVRVHCSEGAQLTVQQLTVSAI